MESKPTKSKPVYNPYPESASTGIPGFIEEIINKNKKSQTSENFGLSNFNKNDPESVIRTQQTLIDMGLLTEQDAKGG